MPVLDDFATLTRDYSATLKREPTVRYAWSEFAEVDDPARIRWRAVWDKDYSDDLPHGIWMECYPVVRKTRCGAWIDPHAYRQATKQPWEEGAPANAWGLSDSSLHRFVYDRSGASWAKPTRALALHSLGYRLTRWSNNVRRDVARVNAACKVADALLFSDSEWDARPEHVLFWPGHEAAQYRLPLADVESPLGVALRSLKVRYERGEIEKNDHIDAVLAVWGGSE